MKKIHYSWVICGACMWLFFCSTGLSVSAFSVYRPYILSENNFTNTQGSILLLLVSLAGVVATSIIDKLVGKIGTRKCAALAMTINAASFVIYGTTHSFLGFCVASALSGVVVSFGGTALISLILSRWFKSQRGTAISLASAGSGVAGILAPPIIALIIANISLQAAFLIEALFIAISAVIIFFLLRDTPEDKSLSPYESTTKDKADKLVHGKELRKGELVIVYIAVAMIGYIAGLNISHRASFYTELGFDNIAVSTILSSAGLTLLVGSLALGSIADRLGVYRTNCIFCGLLLAGQIIGCTPIAKTLLGAHTSALFVGLGLPLSSVGLSVLVSFISSKESYARMTRMIHLCCMGGSIASSFLPGIIADFSGKYLPAFQSSVVLTLVMTLLLQTICYRAARSQR